MSTLLDILKQFPNARVTISSSTPRKKPYEGELRVLARKGRMIRVRRKAYGPGNRVIGDMVRNGRPQWDWVAESTLSALDRGTYMHTRAARGDLL